MVSVKTFFSEFAKVLEILRRKFLGMAKRGVSFQGCVTKGKGRGGLTDWEFEEEKLCSSRKMALEIPLRTEFFLWYMVSRSKYGLSSYGRGSNPVTRGSRRDP